MTALIFFIGYITVLLTVSIAPTFFSRQTSQDYYVASRALGPVLFLLSVFGTTMTAFAIVGSTGESFERGIGVYGMMASWSGLVHSAMFFIVGVKLWALGKKHGYLTQVQFFRDRFESDMLGMMLFVIIIALLVPYLLVSVISAGSTMQTVTIGALPEMFPATKGGIPFWLGALSVCVVVLVYVFVGGMRSTAWANAFQTAVFLILGVATYFAIAGKLGGISAATQSVVQHHPDKLIRGDNIPPMEFLTYAFIPLSVAMFPHLFQHWLTAKSARVFRLTLICHPTFIMIIWAPCIMLGIWATSAHLNGQLLVPEGTAQPRVLGMMVGKLADPMLSGLLTAGILVAIMSSLDSQFLCLGTMFTNDVILHHFGAGRFTDHQKVMLGRGFIVLIVAITFALGLYLKDTRGVFTLGIWSFSGYAALAPLVIASLYWRRTTAAGAIASILAAAVAWALLFQQSGYGANPKYLFLGMLPAASITAIAALVLVVVSLCTSRPSEATLRRFFIDEKSRVRT